MTVARATFRALAALLAALLSAPSWAQPVSVTAGEHADFTRIVVQSRGAFEARVVEAGADLRIEGIDRPIQLDTARLFQRIPRTRLAAARLDGDTLVLTRPCACPARVLVVGPGVLAIDLRDGPALPPEPAARPWAAPPLRIDPARGAGLALAQRLSSGAAAEEPPPPEAPPVAPGQLLAQLSAQLAAAQSRGIVSPTLPAPQPRAMGQPVDLPALADMGPHLRLRDPEVPAIAARTDAAGSSACPDPEHLDFLSEPPGNGFSARLAELRAGQFGEFDQPDPGALRALVRHYLVWGLGAEARGLIDTATVEIPGAELLGGLADVIEDHATNRRARLAAHRDCPGLIGFFALVAAADATLSAEGAATAVMVFNDLPAPLRAILGPELVRRLLAAGEIDGARMALEALRRAAPEDEVTPQLLAAEVARARGALDSANEHLSRLGPEQFAAQRLRLELGLQRGEPLGIGALDDVMALAEAERSVESGRALAELAIRHHALARRPAQGLVMLDRLAVWLDPTPGASERLGDLRRLLWSEVLELPDHDFLVLVLGRDDWRDGLGDPMLRAGIDARLIGLGLGRLIATGSTPAPPEPPQAEAEGPGADDPGATGDPPAAALAMPPQPAPGEGEPAAAAARRSDLAALDALEGLADSGGQALDGAGRLPDIAQVGLSSAAEAAPLAVQTAPPVPDDALDDALRALAASRSLRTDLQALGLSVP
jgi:hypothetical protein